MPKRRKKRRLARPPLTKLDKCLYLAGAAFYIVAVIACVIALDLLEEVYYFSDPSVLAVKRHASEFLIIPAFFYLMLSAIVIFLIPYGIDQPLFGDPKIRYGSPPWASDCYPIFGRQRHPARRTPKGQQVIKRMLQLWLAGLLVSLALLPLSFFGRDCLLRDYSIVSYDMLNCERKHVFPLEFSSLELKAYVAYHRGWTTSVNAELKTTEGERFSFASNQFVNRDRSLALRSMQTIKDMFPSHNVRLEGRDKLYSLVEHGQYTAEEAALLYDLFDSDMQTE